MDEPPFIHQDHASVMGKETIASPMPMKKTPTGNSTERMSKLEYLELMHRTPTNVDWRAIKRQNIEEAHARRRAAMQNPKGTPLGTWKELGSRNLAGRIHVAAWSSDGNALYAGADRGGLWKGNLDGTNWTPPGDNIYGGVHEIAVVPGDAGQPDTLITIWEDWWGAAFVHRSADEGLTWTIPQGVRRLTKAKRILVMDDADHTIFLVVEKNDKWQLMVSTDRGESFTWNRTLSTIGDIWTPRTYAGPLYLIEARRIFKTEDGGATWQEVGSLIPKTGDAQLLAGSEAPGLAFYVAMGNEGKWSLQYSDDGGDTWKEVEKNLWSFFTYWQSLAASTQDSRLVAFGGTDMFYSRDAGFFWLLKNDFWEYMANPAENLHVDTPGLYAFPDPSEPCGETWYICTDGGVYDSRDQFETVRNLSMSGLGVSQYYDVMTSRRNPDIVVAGSQDQGYQRAVIDGSPPPSSGPWLDFDQIEAGDFGHFTSGNGAHDLVFLSTPMWIHAHEGEEDPILYGGMGSYGLGFPDGELFAWMPFIHVDPLEPNDFFFCAQKLYKYTRLPHRWKCEPYSEQRFTPGFCSAVAFSPLDPQRAWATTTEGRIYYSNDHAKTWTEASNYGPEWCEYFSTTILPSSTDKDVCWVAGNGYSRPPVMRTRDGGVTWERASEGLPPTLVYCLAEAPDNSGRVFCGSEIGAWVFNPDTETWSDIMGTDAPVATYWACEAVPSQNLMRFATYNRGIWDYYLNTPGYFPYGELQGGANTLLLKNPTIPRVSKPTTFIVTDCEPGTIGLLGISEEKEHTPLLGGTLLLDLQNPAMMLIPFAADSNGEASISFRLPSESTYIEKEIYFQAAALDATAVHGWSFSNGLRAKIGR